MKFTDFQSILERGGYFEIHDLGDGTIGFQKSTTDESFYIANEGKGGEPGMANDDDLNKIQFRLIPVSIPSYEGIYYIQSAVSSNYVSLSNSGVLMIEDINKQSNHYWSRKVL